jgi:miniconductance mechanosensitive channel
MINWLESLASTHPALPVLAGGLILIVVAVIADLATKKLLLVGMRSLVKRTSTSWDDALVRHNVFGRLAQIVPALLMHAGITLVPGAPDAVIAITHNVANAWMILVITLTIAAALKSVNLIYEQSPDRRGRPIKGFVQIIEIAVYAFGGVLFISALVDRSPLILLSGMGAISAVAMFVFKDALASLVASIQMSGQDMIRVGDWLEAPQFGADGDVIDVALYTVTVQNWDKTITMIPTSKLVYDAFKNWRGMDESGGRRIKRSLNIDINSIRFLTEDEVHRFEDFALLKDYIASKQGDLKSYNDALVTPGTANVNLRKLTNIGTFRAYVFNYLKHHPKIHQDMTLIVRQLQPGSEGLPIEIYCFSNDTAWANYEDIQSDIFDHSLAIVPEFGLRVYQQPAGSDIQAISVNSQGA